MDIEKAFEVIQNNLIVTRERENCMTNNCPCCSEHKFSTDIKSTVNSCLNCGYTVMLNKGHIERFKGQGVFALSRGAKGGIFQLLKVDGKLQLKHYLKLLQMLLVVQLMNLIIVFFILLKMIK